MKVLIEGNIFLESDERQFMLREYTGQFDKSGKELYKTLGYFSSVNQSLKHLVKLEVMKTTASNLKELLTDVERIEKKIESLVKI